MGNDLDKLQAENMALKALLSAHGIKLPAQVDDTVKVTDNNQSNASTLTLDAKVRLFRRLFRGRNDVNPIRWESSQSGKAGYSPVCANEWRHGVCEKPRIKCGDCNHSLYVPVTDQVIFHHLKGKITAGVYPPTRCELRSSIRHDSSSVETA